MYILEKISDYWFPAHGLAKCYSLIFEMHHRFKPGSKLEQIRGLAVCGALVLLAGCAAPGPPLPPTLNLPQVVVATSLSAVRVGDEVRLHWTTPSQTTDKLLIKGPVTAAICRDSVAGGVARLAAKAPCVAVARVKVAAGASDAADALPAALTAGPARLLAYRVELLNSAGRTAGASAAVFAAAGQPLEPVAGFAGNLVKEGVMLHWQQDRSDAGGTVELERTILDPQPEATQPRGGPLPGAEKEAVVTRFRAGAGESDPGGTIDRTVEIGHSYRYTAERVKTLELGGERVELRSVASSGVGSGVTLAVRDVFPPAVPEGLVAAPGFEGDPPRATIDLSWEPDVDQGNDAQVAGYRVYRRDAASAGAWQRIGPELVAEPAYHDAAVVAGRQYAYRVTAVSTAGNESAPGAQVAETAPAQ
jgi:hypothetical protein